MITQETCEISSNNEKRDKTPKHSWVIVLGAALNLRRLDQLCQCAGSKDKTTSRPDLLQSTERQAMRLTETFSFIQFYFLKIAWFGLWAQFRIVHRGEEGGAMCPMPF